jgi:hypothetical protein
MIFSFQKLSEMCVEKGAFGLCQKQTHVKSDKVPERFFIYQNF